VRFLKASGLTYTFGMRGARLTQSPEFMLYALCVTTMACVLLLCALPRALAPVDVPPLVLDRAAVAEVERADKAARARVPRTDDARALADGLLLLGDAENEMLDKGPTAEGQRQILGRMFQKFVQAHGLETALALRSDAVERLESALRLQLSDAETERVLGMFPEAIAQHSVTHDGIEIAPHFVMRTLYKARWNIAMGLAPDYKLAPVELQAYHGWLALHTTFLSPEPRGVALQQYGAAGGRHVAEARGVLAFLSHDYKHAVAAFEEAYRQSPTLRLRNWLRGAQVARDTVSEEH
jgi:hypothetical protein